jgi:hypothetical protein
VQVIVVVPRGPEAGHLKVLYLKLVETALAAIALLWNTCQRAGEGPELEKELTRDPRRKQEQYPAFCEREDAGER